MASNRNPKFAVVKESATFIIIQDVGPWDKHLSITNGAEECVAELAADYALGSRRIGYYDSEGRLDELLHDGHGRFTGFSAGFKAGEAEARAVIDAFCAHTPFLADLKTTSPSGPITFDESKMPPELRSILLTRINTSHPALRAPLAENDVNELRAAYPPDWPMCPGCGLPAMDGHVTCGRSTCRVSADRP